MSPDGTISVEHVWKRFRSDRKRMLLRDELQRLRARRRGTQDGHRWVLRDIGFDITPGESVSLVGVNGSGKSTLLKLLTRVMHPYYGRVSVSGRVGALIEVRAGIHPDLTGRENVYLYGSLLGLPRKTVARRFDEIVAFAEVEDAIDRQVKFYSSGMQMRIGFAVAAFLEPDVLLVDEVLAVGDAAFQQKCLDRMREVLSGGTTLVLVSHDLAAVEATTSRSIWLEQGTVRADGPVRDVLDAYRTAIEEAAESGASVSGLVRLVKAVASGPGGQTAFAGGPLEVDLVLETPVPRSGRLYLGISNGPATPVFVVGQDLFLGEGETAVRCRIPRLPLPRGKYYLWVSADERRTELLPWHPAAAVEVSGSALPPGPRGVVRPAPVHVDTEWTVTPR